MMNNNLTTGPADDLAVTAAIRALMTLDAAQLVALASLLATVDADLGERLGDTLLDAVYDAQTARGLVTLEGGWQTPARPPSAQWAALDDDDDVGYEYAPGAAQ